MNSIEVFLLGLIGFVLLLNVIASIWLLKDENLERFQIVMQLLITWLLPLVGSIIIISLQWSHRDTTTETDVSSSNNGGYIADSSAGGSGD